MHYYQFNIGDYSSHTQHLDPLEDLAYRRMMDLYYLHESPLPESAEEIGRLIRMRTHSECIAVVLRDFFTLHSDGYRCQRIDNEIEKFNLKSDKAKASAKARWNKIPVKSTANDKDAKAMRTHSERNAKQETLNTKHKPLTIKYTEGDLAIAHDFYSSLLKINPSQKKPDFKKWGESVRKIREIDGKTHEEITELFEWVNNHHEFWRGKVLAPDKLRAKWDQLTIQKNTVKPKKRNAFDDEQARLRKFTEQDYIQGEAIHEQQLIDED